MTLRFFSGSLFVLTAISACKDGPGPPPLPGPPSNIVGSSGNNQVVPANTVVPSPIVVAVRDANGTGVPGQTVTFAVIAGGGSLTGANTATTGTDGTVTAPSWRLGKSHVPQTLRATHGTWSADISATVQTNYRIEVRFFGEPMSASDQALFSNAAARLEGIVMGDVLNAQATDQDVESICGVTGEPPLNEVIDDVLIYASIDTIDGPGQVLARAGWCLSRNTSTGFMPAVGIMFFDERDLASLAGAGSLQDVITHEMLHVLGFGTLWRDRGFLLDGGSVDPRYTGPQGTAGCQTVGGIVSCAMNVPVEGNSAPPGTRDGHWRESTFNTELMTGFVDGGALPISSMTIGSLADLGYVVNNADNDPYTIFIGALRAGALSGAGLPAARRAGWERIHDIPKWILEPNGQVRKYVRAK